MAKKHVIFNFIFLLFLVNLSSAIANNFVYYGVHIGHHNLDLEDKYGNDIYPNTFTQITHFFGTKIKWWGLGIELNSPATQTKILTINLNPGDIFLGVSYIDTTEFTLETSAKIKGFGADNYFYYQPFFSKTLLYLALGINFYNLDYSHKFIKHNGNNLSTQMQDQLTRNFQINKIIPRTKIGLMMPFLFQSINFKLEYSWEQTSKFGTIPCQQPNLNLQLKFKNSTQINLGVLMRF